MMPQSVADYQISKFIAIMNMKTNILREGILPITQVENIIEGRQLEYINTIVRKDPPNDNTANAGVVFNILYMEYSVKDGRSVKVGKTISVEKNPFAAPKGPIDPRFSDSLYSLLQYKEVREKIIQETKEFQVMLKLAGEI